jgi:hypothetical protein
MVEVHPLVITRWGLINPAEVQRARGFFQVLIQVEAHPNQSLTENAAAALTILTTCKGHPSPQLIIPDQTLQAPDPAEAMQATLTFMILC